MKFAVAALLAGSTSGALVAMTACYDSTVVTDSAAFVALNSVNNAKNLVTARTKCDATVRAPATADVTAEKKVILDKQVMLAMGYPYQKIYSALTIAAAVKTANQKRFKDFGVATGVGDISCAIDTSITTACVALVGTLEQQDYAVKTAMNFYTKAQTGCGTDATKLEACMALAWTGFLKVGAAFKTDAVLEKTDALRVTWATAKNTSISAALLALQKPKAGSAGASCKAVAGAVATDKAVRPKVTAATDCCMGCKKTATDTTQKEVIGVTAGLKCTIEKTAATATVVDYYATEVKAVTEQWDGVCIMGALKMVSSTAALLATSYMMA